MVLLPVYLTYMGIISTMTCIVSRNLRGRMGLPTLTWWWWWFVWIFMKIVFKSSSVDLLSQSNLFHMIKIWRFWLIFYISLKIGGHTWRVAFYFVPATAPDCKFNVRILGVICRYTHISRTQEGDDRGVFKIWMIS